MVENAAAAADGTGIVERLARKRVLITGVTGFLGQVLLERLLLDFPETAVAVLVRRQQSQSAHARVEYLLRKPAFDPLRERLGEIGLLRALDDRVEVIEGDFSKGPPDLPPNLDVVFHCAATVSFDPPIDEGFGSNLLGAMNLYEGVVRTGSSPHLVHVSTAYVAGVQKGVIPEATLAHRVDWRMEADLALRARQDVEAQSRRPEILDSFMEKARKEHSRAGPTTVADDAEQRRKDWVSKRLVDHGRSRARSLGWPDAYTFTKAMGERAVEGLASEHRLPLSIVRPSIIESALLHPFPGWIDGFKMADPIIRAYGLGQIPEFPGIPEGIVDIIPVDFVVNAMLAIATSAPEPRSPRYYHVCSGDRNPLQYHQLYALVREYFEAHPLPERGRGQHKVPEWRFPGNLKVERMLRRAEKLTDLAERVVVHLPKSKTMRDAVSRVDRDQARVDFVRRYSDLYGPYTEAEVIYTDDETVALWQSLPVEDRARFPFDAPEIDWKHYLQQVHTPAVTEGLRELSRQRQRPEVMLVERAEPVLAVFDMEGTIITSNVVESYVWARMADLELEDWPGELLGVFGRIPSYLQADRRDRGEFLRTFYRRYEGCSVAGLRRLIDGHVAEFMLQKASQAAIRRVRRHRAAGHRTILLTAAAEPFVTPLAPLFDLLIGAELEVNREGRYTGFMSSPPLVGEARAAWLRRFSASEGINLKNSYAYADSHSDLPLLRAVGNPVVVSPDSALYRYATRRRWPIEDWNMSSGMPRVRFPRPAER